MESSPTAAEQQGVVLSRFIVFAVAVSVVLTACAGTNAETTVTTQPASVTGGEAVMPSTSQLGVDEGAEGAVVTTSLPPPGVEMERVAGGSWFEGGRMTSVAVGGPGLVAAGAAGGRDGDTDAAVWTSSDGNTWVRVDDDPAVFGGEPSRFGAASEQAINDLVAGSLGVVAVGADIVPGDSDAAVWVSTDGLVWERLPDDEVFGGAGDQVMRSVVQTADTVVAVGESSGLAAVWVSNDGREWTRALIDGAPGGTGTEPSAISDVALGGPGLVAVGSVGVESRPAVWLSAGGATWRRLPDPIIGASSSDDESAGSLMLSIAASEGGFVVVGSKIRPLNSSRVASPTTGPVVWTSNDGFEWQMLDVRFEDAPTAEQSPGPYDHLKGPAPVFLADVAWDGDRLVAVGRYDMAPSSEMLPGLMALWVSIDGGSTWQMGSEIEVVNGPGKVPTDSGPTHLTRLGSSFVVVGHDDFPTGEETEWGMRYESSAAVWMARLTEG